MCLSVMLSRMISITHTHTPATNTTLQRYDDDDYDDDKAQI